LLELALPCFLVALGGLGKPFWFPADLVKAFCEKTLVISVVCEHPVQYGEDEW
jgi:hypothetical protein